MKRFDKRYLYYNFLTGFLRSLLILYFIFGELFTDPEAPVADMSVLIPILAIAFIVIYACSVAYSIAFYILSGYEFTENEIKCNMGVLFRKRSLLDYRKIHAVNKKQGIIQRIFDIAVLTIDSGSTNTSHQAEITIIGKAAAWARRPSSSPQQPTPVRMPAPAQSR